MNSDYKPQIIHASVDRLWPLINRHVIWTSFVLKGNIKNVFGKYPKALKLDQQILDVKLNIIKNRCQPIGMYQFFKVRRESNTMIVLSEDEKSELQHFTFPRQLSGINIV